MRILLFSKEYPPKIGGAGVIAKSIFENVKNIENIDIKLIKLNSFLDYVLFPFAIYYIAKFDYIILNDLFSKKYFMKLVRRKYYRKTILYLHGSEPEYLISDKKYCDEFLKLCESSSAIIAVSSYMKDKFINSIPINNNISCLEQKTVIIKNGIDVNIFREHRNKLKNNDKLIVITTSRLIKEKGYFRMADIINNYKNNISNLIEWNIVGNGCDESLIRDYCYSIGLQKEVVFHGALNHQELAILYNKSHIFLLLSELKESLGLVYMEAALCGCYSIGYNRYGVKEAIINNKTGVLIHQENNDEIALIMSRVFMNKKSVIIDGCNYSKDVMVKKIVTTLEEL